MLRAFMNAQSETQNAGLTIPFPCPETQLFRYAATRPIVNLLVDNPYTRFTIRDLHRATDHSLDNVRHAIIALEEVNLVTITAEGNRKLVGINRARLRKPADPITYIPQPEFHQPIKRAVTHLRETLDDVCGIVLFGSVARGEADRQSDIDLFVLVGDNQATNQQAAHEVANELAEDRFNGDRYRFQILVESVETAHNYGERLRDVLTNCITLSETDALGNLKQEVLANGR
jgi:predicted nucleotidyltransferase